MFRAIASVAVSSALSACTAPAGTPLSSPGHSSATNNEHSRPASDSGFDYVDGQYTAEGQYGSLSSSIGVTVTLTGDIVTAVSVTPHATDPTSLDLQNRFAAAVPTVVVGRDIDEITVARLAGSSHTPHGFNAALEEIKAQAN
jgi:uncharacterized protein with FMN-binding domain